MQDNKGKTGKKAGGANDPSVWSQLTANPMMLTNLVVMILVWLSASFCYYLISYQLKYLRGDIFVNGLTSSVSELTTPRRLSFHLGV